VIGLASRIRRASQEWEPAVEAAIFGTIDPDEIEQMIVGFVARRLGSVEQEGRLSVTSRSGPDCPTSALAVRPT
jgi:hypothetical protein